MAVTVKRWFSNPTEMINDSLLNPKSIVVVGASNEIEKPGGKVLKNLIDGAFAGRLYVVNQREDSVQGIACLSSVEDLDTVELAILSIPAKFCPQIVRTLATEKETRAFIILSAGFGEESEQGKQCALIYCNGMIEEIPQYKGGLNPRWEFWQEVKQIIQTK